MAITPSILRSHVETDLSSEALQTLINAAVAEVEHVAGPLGGTRTWEHETGPGDRRLYLPRPVASLTEIREGSRLDDLAVVDVSDYSVILHGQAVQRHTGHWARWVRVTYVPPNDLAIRDAVVIDLCKLALHYSGLQSESAGDHSEQALDHEKERARILRRLTLDRRLIA